MKKAITQLLGLLVALGLLAGIGLAAWFGLEQLVAVFAALDAQVARVTAIGSLAVLAAAVIVAAALRRSARDRLAVPLREEKAATYRLFVDCWQQRLSGASTPALEEGLDALDRLLALCGSAPVIGSHVALRRLVQRQGLNQVAWLPLLSGALLQIRKELSADAMTADDLEALLAPSTDAVASATVTPAFGSASAA